MPIGPGIHLPSVKTKGALGFLMERIARGAADRVWPKYCMQVDSATKTETYAFAGAIPRPHIEEGDRRFQGMMSHTYSLTDDAHELSFIIDRDSVDDDQTGTVQRRLGEVADACNIYEDELFALSISNGDVSGNNAYDGVVFFGDTRTIGNSANIDNGTTSAAASGTIPNAQEVLSAMEAIKAAMWNYEDDQGRPGMIRRAMSSIRIVAPATYERALTEAVNSTLMPNATTLTNTAVDNVWGRGLFEFDILPDLVEADEMVVCAVGGDTRPFVCQERQREWEVVIFDNPQDVADNRGVKVLCRKRIKFGYGEPRMAVLHTWS